MQSLVKLILQDVYQDSVVRVDEALKSRYSCRKKRLCNAPLTRRASLQPLVKSILQDVYEDIVVRVDEMLKSRFIQKQKLCNDLRYITSKLQKTPAAVHAKQRQNYVVFVGSLSGREELCVLDAHSSYADLYAAARKAFDVPKKRTLRLFYDVPWIDGFESDALPCKSQWECKAVFSRTVKVHGVTFEAEFEKPVTFETEFEKPLP